MQRENPMEAKRKRILYKEEFRRQAVEMVILSGKAQAQVARELGCSEIQSESLEEGVFEATAAGLDRPAAKKSGANVCGDPIAPRIAAVRFSR
jgi:transposase-like protein